MTENVKDIAERGVKTFFETAIAYALPALAGVNYFGGDNKKTVLLGIGISAAASGLSAVYNGIIRPFIANKSAHSIAEETESDNYITEDESEENVNG